MVIPKSKTFFKFLISKWLFVNSKISKNLQLTEYIHGMWGLQFASSYYQEEKKY
jgi:hypothetical protein